MMGKYLRLHHGPFCEYKSIHYNYLAVCLIAQSAICRRSEKKLNNQKILVNFSVITSQTDLLC